MFVDAANDSLKLFHLELCDHQKFQIKCPRHTKIAIENAFYGYSKEISKNVCEDVNVKQQNTKSKSLLFHDAHFEESQCEYLNAKMVINYNVKEGQLHLVLTIF